MCIQKEVCSSRQILFHLFCFQPVCFLPFAGNMLHIWVFIAVCISIFRMKIHFFCEKESISFRKPGRYLHIPLKKLVGQFQWYGISNKRWEKMHLYTSFLERIKSLYQKKNGFRVVVLFLLSICTKYNCLLFIWNFAPFGK